MPMRTAPHFSVSVTWRDDAGWVGRIASHGERFCFDMPSRSHGRQTFGVPSDQVSLQSQQKYPAPWNGDHGSYGSAISAA